MVDEDRKRFAELVAAVYEFYDRGRGKLALSEQALSLWWESMLGFEFEAVRRAFGRHAMNPDAGQFPPMPADVIRELGGTTQDAAMLAWSKVAEAVRSVGGWNSVVFDDPIVHRVVVDLGGWPALCSVEAREWQFVERRFRDAYRAHRNRGGVPDHPTRLVGRFEATNSAAGYESAPPTMIGDAARCSEIAAGKLLAPSPLRLKEIA